MLQELSLNRQHAPEPCRRAFRRLQAVSGLRTLRASLGWNGWDGLWESCCDPFRFDMLGHRALCFTRNDWEVRFCCAALQDGGRFSRLWQRVASARPSARPDLSLPNSACKFGSCEYAFVAYHKTGTFVATQLIGYDDLPGPFASAFLGRRTRVLFDHNLRGRNSTLYNSTFEYTETFMRISPRGRLILIYNPLEHEIKQDVHFAVSAGKIVHFIRRPTSIIVSGYLYHLKGSKYEYWLHAPNPPNCHHCDYEAWDQIFRPCDFGCTYLQRLQTSDLQEGLRIEILRARWSIIKMLQNWNRWQHLPNVLHMFAADFEANLTSSLRRVAYFFEPRLPSHMLPRLLSGAIELGLDPTNALAGCLSKRCQEEAGFALKHSSATSNQSLKRRAEAILPSIEEWQAYIAPADAFYDALWVQSMATK